MDFQESSLVRESDVRDASLLAQQLLEFDAYLFLNAPRQGFIEHRVHTFLTVFDESWEDLLLEEIAHDVAQQTGEFLTHGALDLFADHRLQLGAIHTGAALRGGG